MSEERREKFISNFCLACVQPASNEGCGKSFQSILAEIKVPSTLMATHLICEYCLDIYHRSANHVENCIFAKQSLQLQAGGWATTTSSMLLRQIRTAKFKYRKPITNMITNLLLNNIIPNTVLMPIPMGKSDTRSIWDKVILDAAKQLGDVEVIQAIMRNKNLSTRQSSAHRRARIAKEEYIIDSGLAQKVAGRSVIIFDDNVTTGTTIVQCAELLKPYDPDRIILLVIERYVSPRIINRIDNSIEAIECASFNVKKKSSG